MRADRDHSTAYPVSASSFAFNVWPQAGFSSFAYRLAKLTAPRSGVVAIVTALFYLV